MKCQYCGEVGKRANCQAGVYLGYASRKGYTLLDRRLYLPQEWVEDEAYAERQRRCGVPAALTFKTKPTLGWEMIQAVRQVGTVRAQWVVCDEAFRRDTSLLDCLDGIDRPVVLCRGVPRHAGLAATAGYGGAHLVGPGMQTYTHPRAGRGSQACRGGAAGGYIASRPLATAYDQGGE